MSLPAATAYVVPPPSPEYVWEPVVLFEHDYDLIEKSNQDRAWKDEKHKALLSAKVDEATGRCIRVGLEHGWTIEPPVFYFPMDPQPWRNRNLAVVACGEVRANRALENAARGAK